MAEATRACPECGKDISDRRSDAKTCGPSCYERHIHRPAYLDAPPQQCLECQRSFIPSNIRALCCSGSCSKKRNNRIQRAKVASPPRVSDCRQCGDEFLALRSDSWACSSRCRQAWNYRNQRATTFGLTCDWCGKAFNWHNRRPKYCDTKCRRRAAYAKFADDRRKYSREWNAKNSQDPRFRPASIAKDQRRRALRLLAPGVGVTGAEWSRILRRAQGRCFYCKRRPRDGLTMEHVIPLARGGPHAPGNIVAACRTCNFGKSDLLVMEWRLRSARRHKVTAT